MVGNYIEVVMLLIKTLKRGHKLLLSGPYGIETLPLHVHTAVDDNNKLVSRSRSTAKE